ncbi:unnamed protein product [Ambrosiozyma monospora]|uniref:Unnamed protein product n=1 Tax=Ambrosiozyma monospora TaxID=43982 RepID=A0ACB5T5B3_AMBMO|nr:unnamed protein product [Ambrosiozyma monospora]
MVTRFDHNPISTRHNRYKFGKSTMPEIQVPNESDSNIGNIELFKAAYQDQLEVEEDNNLEEEEAEENNDQA